MPLLPGKGNVGHNIKTEQDAGKPHKQAVAIAMHTADKHGGEDHKAAIAKMHPKHLHEMVKAAHAGKYGPEAKQMAQQAMQGQSGAPMDGPGEEAQEQGGGKDYAGMFGLGSGGAQQDEPPPPPDRASMFARRSLGGE